MLKIIFFDLIFPILKKSEILSDCWDYFEKIVFETSLNFGFKQLL